MPQNLLFVFKNL